MRLVLADFSWLCYRYYHSPLHKSMGVEIEGTTVNTGRFFGFGQFIKAASDSGYEIIFCEDFGSPSGGNLLAEYKAGRVSDPAVFEKVEELQGVCSCSSNVSFARALGIEADDIMASLYFQKKDAYENVVIYSGDNDLLQIVPYGAKVARSFSNGSFEYVGDAYLGKKFPGVDIRNLLKYRILVGDPSDRIPAVVPRLCRKFVKEFILDWEKEGLVKALIKHKDSPNGQKLVANKAALVRNIDLMNLTKYRDLTKSPPSLEIYKFPKRLDLLKTYKLHRFAEYVGNVT